MVIEFAETGVAVPDARAEAYIKSAWLAGRKHLTISTCTMLNAARYLHAVGDIQITHILFEGTEYDPMFPDGWPLGLANQNFEYLREIVCAKFKPTDLCPTNLVWEP